eukprot:2388480-Rhodomonas_salina.1
MFTALQSAPVPLCRGRGPCYAVAQYQLQSRASRLVLLPQHAVAAYIAAYKAGTDTQVAHSSTIQYHHKLVEYTAGTNIGYGATETASVDSYFCSSAQ